MTAPDVASIADGLTEAQREAVLLWDEARPDEGRIARLMEMMDPADPRVIRKMGLATKPSKWGPGSKLTPLGEQVRAHILRSERDA